MNWTRNLFALITATLAAGAVSAAFPFVAQAYAGCAGGPNTFTAAQAAAELSRDPDPIWRGALAHCEAQAASSFSAAPALRSTAAGQQSLLVRGDVHRKEIALTFDDGPHPAWTPQLLDVLRQCRVPATFFLVGEMAERYPGLVRDEVAAGDEVGNHTYHHVSLVKVGSADDAAEIAACGDVLKDITGKRPYLFRPPGGKLDPAALSAAAAQGYTTVMWTDDPGDYASPGVEAIVERTLHCARPGGILLLHDGIPQTIAALPQIVASLRAEGFTFVSMDQMLRDRAAAERRFSPAHPSIQSVARVPHAASRQAAAGKLGIVNGKLT